MTFVPGTAVAFTHVTLSVVQTQGVDLFCSISHFVLGKALPKEAKCYCCSNGHRLSSTGELIQCDRELIYGVLQLWFFGWIIFIQQHTTSKWDWTFVSDLLEVYIYITISITITTVHIGLPAIQVVAWNLTHHWPLRVEWWLGSAFWPGNCLRGCLRRGKSYDSNQVAIHVSDSSWKICTASAGCNNAGILTFQTTRARATRWDWTPLVHVGNFSWGERSLSTNHSLSLSQCN